MKSCPASLLSSVVLVSSLPANRCLPGERSGTELLEVVNGEDVKLALRDHYENYDDQGTLIAPFPPSSPPKWPREARVNCGEY